MRRLCDDRLLYWGQGSIDYQSAVADTDHDALARGRRFRSPGLDRLWDLDRRDEGKGDKDRLSTDT